MHVFKYILTFLVTSHHMRITVPIEKDMADSFPNVQVRIVSHTSRVYLRIVNDRSNVNKINNSTQIYGVDISSVFPEVR